MLQHFTNASAQGTQGARFINYHYLGNKDDLKPATSAAVTASAAKDKVTEVK